MNGTPDSVSQAILRVEWAEGLTNRDIGKIAEIDDSEISRIKNGSRQFKVVEIERIANHQQLPMAALICKALTCYVDNHVAGEKLAALLRAVAQEVDQVLADRRQNPSAYTLAIAGTDAGPVKVQGVRQASRSIPIGSPRVA